MMVDNVHNNWNLNKIAANDFCSYCKKVKQFHTMACCTVADMTKFVTPLVIQGEGFLKISNLLVEITHQRKISKPWKEICLQLEILPNIVRFSWYWANLSYIVFRAVSSTLFACKFSISVKFHKIPSETQNKYPDII